MTDKIDVIRSRVCTTEHIICANCNVKSAAQKLTEKERADLKNIMKKSGIFKDSPLGSRKRR